MLLKRSISGMIISLVCCALLSVQGIAQEEEKPNPKLTEVWEPVPPVVTPGDGSAAPSDAIVLFDGTDFSNWVNKKGETPKWKIENETMTVVKKTGAIFTKKTFGDCQLHIEFRTPVKIKGKGQGRGNSGIFLQNRYELQVLDSYDNTTYPNGQCGSIYKQYIPLVNACRKPGEWQTYDIMYMAPQFNKDGILITPARMTVLQNGVLIQNNIEIKGVTFFRGLPSYESHGNAPIQLQDHGNPVSYRNIWIREL
jgi:hypothetical protein